MVDPVANDVENGFDAFQQVPPQINGILNSRDDSGVDLAALNLNGESPIPTQNGKFIQSEPRKPFAFFGEKFSKISCIFMRLLKKIFAKKRKSTVFLLTLYSWAQFTLLFYILDC